MIINIILFFSFYLSLYSSTPTPTPNDQEKDLSHLFKGQDRKYLVFRYKQLAKFYEDNFSFFLEKVLSLKKDDLEKLLSKDEYYLIFQGKMTNEGQMDQIKGFFNSLIDLNSNKKKYSSYFKSKEEEREIFDLKFKFIVLI